MKVRIALILWTASILSPLAPVSADVFLSGQLDLIARNAQIEERSNRTNAGYSPFDGIRTRLFCDASVTDKVAVFVQFFASNYSSTSLYGAYVRWDHSAALHLSAGLIPLPVGLWGPRTYADKNPLIATPAMYQYKTSLALKKELQATTEELLTMRGTAEGSPILYDFCWNHGVALDGSHGQFDYGLALQAGSLGAPARAVSYDLPNVTAKLNWVPGPWLLVGGWVAVGPYLPESAASQLPVGQVIEDYYQQSLGGVMRIAYGYVEIYAEGVLNRFEHPILGDLDAAGGYADIRWRFNPKWYAAARIDAIRFDKIQTSVGEVYWDYPLARAEVGVGHNVTRKVLAKAVVQIIRYTDAPASLDEEIVALQTSFGF